MRKALAILFLQSRAPDDDAEGARDRSKLVNVGDSHCARSFSFKLLRPANRGDSMKPLVVTLHIVQVKIRCTIVVARFTGGDLSRRDAVRNPVSLCAARRESVVVGGCSYL